MAMPARNVAHCCLGPPGPAMGQQRQPLERRHALALMPAVAVITTTLGKRVSRASPVPFFLSFFFSLFGFRALRFLAMSLEHVPFDFVVLEGLVLGVSWSSDVAKSCGLRVSDVANL